MKKTIWKSILCAMLVTLTACILCIGAFAAKYTCIKSGCTREAAKGSAYCSHEEQFQRLRQRLKTVRQQLQHKA